jgi:hypothetical protein
MYYWNIFTMDPLPGEEWKDIDGYVGLYAVSNLGRVKTLPKHVNGPYGSKPSRPGRILRQPFVKGYCRVKLWRNNKYKDLFVHRLVANAFIPKVEGKEYVNHKFGIRHDNRASELEWCTMAENAEHGFRVNKREHPNKGRVGKRSSRGTPVLVINRFTGEERIFESGNMATKELGLTVGALSHVLHGHYKYTKDYYIKPVPKSSTKK